MKTNAHFCALALALAASVCAVTPLSDDLPAMNDNSLVPRRSAGEHNGPSDISRRSIGPEKAKNGLTIEAYLGRNGQKHPTHGRDKDITTRTIGPRGLGKCLNCFSANSGGGGRGKGTGSSSGSNSGSGSSRYTNVVHVAGEGSSHYSVTHSMRAGQHGMVGKKFEKSASGSSSKFGKSASGSSSKFEKAASRSSSKSVRTSGHAVQGATPAVKKNPKSVRTPGHAVQKTHKRRMVVARSVAARAPLVEQTALGSDTVMQDQRDNPDELYGLHAFFGRALACRVFRATDTDDSVDAVVVARGGGASCAKGPATHSPSPSSHGSLGTHVGSPTHSPTHVQGSTTTTQDHGRGHDSGRGGSLHSLQHYVPPQGKLPTIRERDVMEREDANTLGDER